MTPFGPVSLALLFDPRVRRLSWAERGVLHHLSLVAGVSPDGRTVPVERRPGEADVSAWEQTFGADGARIIGDLVTRSLLTVCAEGLRVTLVARDGAQLAGQRHVALPPEEAPAPPPDVVAARLRKLKFNFKNREGELAAVPAGVTWEAWVETPEGLEVYARRVLGQGRTERARGAGGTFLRSTGTRSDGASGTPAERHRNGQRNAPPSLSETSSPKGKEEEEDVPERHRNGTERNAIGTGQRNALDLLRDAAAGRATLTGAATLEREFAEVLARHGLKGDEVSRAGSAFEEPAAWWPKGKNPAPAHVTLNDLAGFRGEAGYEWRPLAALVAHVRTQARRAAAPARARPASPPPPSPPAARAGEAAARAAARSLIADPQRPKENADA